MYLWQVEYCNSCWVKDYFQITAKDFNEACIKAERILKEQNGKYITGIQKSTCTYYE